MTTAQSAPLRRQLGLAAVAALVVGDMLGSGVFFTPGELASVADHAWQVYLVWALCGFITLCGALTLSELCSQMPEAGASYHIIRAGFGGFWAFLAVWMQLWVAGPGSVAGIAVVFGAFAERASGASVGAAAWGAAAIAFFAGVNALGVNWGGRTQIALTVVKVVGLLGLVGGSLVLAAPALSRSAATVVGPTDDVAGFVRVLGLGVAAVLFTYDGWVDVSHVAGEVRRPERTLPLGLGFGVAGLTLLYLVVNHAYLRSVPLETMREHPTMVASRVATAVFGTGGGAILDALVLVSILGSMGGLVMTLPRLFYTLAAAHVDRASGPLRVVLRPLSRVWPRTATPVGAILFTAIWSIAALAFFGSFSRLVNFFVVPLQAANILMVMSVFPLRRRAGASASGYRVPGYPWTPIVYTVTLAALLVSAVIYRPFETLIGVALTLTGAPFYLWLRSESA